MAVAMNVLIGDLLAESADLERLLAPDVLAVPTPAAGWTVRDQITHLAWFDGAAARAVTGPGAFREEVRAELAKGLDTDLLVRERRSMAAEEVLEWFGAARRHLTEVLSSADPEARIPWYGPDMGLVSFTTARLMETWAHGQDVADGLAAGGYDGGREPTDRLRHVAEIGVRALPWSFAVHGRRRPDAAVRVELTLPSGAPWAAGPEGAADVVRGTALDFCLVVTQRRHPADVNLAVSGPVAEEWISIAQAFAGPPGAGRRPGQFT
ncbi:TIGR03084 family metal-binding protein [Actinoallomurus bryophytorum]|nr:TIGR03084 family metal-binding protein [Actinoallomurus bryophytorum]